MNAAVVLLFALPLVAASLSILSRRRRRMQQAITVTALLTIVGLAVSLVLATRDGVTIATRIGDWPSGLAIVVAADGFTSLLVVITSVMSLVSVGFAATRGDDRHELFHPLVLLLVTGVFLALTTADLFNLFVAFEIMLISSYVLLTLRGGREQVRAGVIYVTVNLLASTVFLLGVALLYGVVGTVNLADLHDLVPEDPAAMVGAGMVTVAVAVKASIVPMHAWLPRAYVHAGPAVTALFSGLLTKVGVYTLFRLYSVVFGGDVTWRPLLLVAAGLTMVVGVLGAVGKGDVRGILAFHMVSQVGYLVLPLGLWTSAAVTAGTFYLLQYVAVKGALFLAAGAIETLTGTGRLSELGGMARSRPMLAAGFMVCALALAGLPPTSGFVGKYLLVLAAFEAGAVFAGAVAVLVSLFTLLSMVKIWNGVFWGEPTPATLDERIALGDEHAPPPDAGAAANPDANPDAHADAAVDAPQPPDARVQRRGGHRVADHAGASTIPRWRVTALIAPCVAIGGATVLLGIGANGLLELIAPAADALIDPSGYLQAVRRS
jgi:multicomponent Na+:H+ antiporter subunit D